MQAQKASFISAPNEKPVHLTLEKNLRASVKLGHPWVFAQALTKLPPAPPGSLALLKTKTGQIIAKGIYDPSSALAFKALALVSERLDDSFVLQRLERAAGLRGRLFPDPSTTNAYRLLNGEGDGLPGLVCDVYDHTAVVKCDGPGAAAFYNLDAVAKWLMTRQASRITTVYERFKTSVDAERGRLVAGDLPTQPVHMLENGAAFKVDVIQGQKTGFFLDQRDNRACVGRLCGEGASLPSSSSQPRVLNVFGYTGGFSIYAGRGHSHSHVTTVDIATPAIAFAEQNWELNGLASGRHEAVCADAFDFLQQAAKGKDKWDMVIVDPPSFAPNQQAVEPAKASYTRLFTLAAQCVRPGGMLALASCSSHITALTFQDVCASALSAAQRLGFTLVLGGQPEDHPSPVAAPELRYLKFNVYLTD